MQVHTAFLRHVAINITSSGGSHSSNAETSFVGMFCYSNSYKGEKLVVIISSKLNYFRLPAFSKKSRIIPVYDDEVVEVLFLDLFDTR